MNNFRNPLGTDRTTGREVYQDDVNNKMPSAEYLDHENTNLFPEELYKIPINLYGKDIIINLKDVLLLADGINFEMRLLADRSAEQMDITLERLASYKLSISSAVDQLNELIYDQTDVVETYHAQLREVAYNSIMKERVADCELGKRTKSTIGNISTADIDTYIFNLKHQQVSEEVRMSMDIDLLPIDEYFTARKKLAILKSKKEKLEKLENILLNRGKELISILDRRMGKLKGREI